MTNHGCGIPWCINEQARSPEQLAEHTSAMWYGSVTGAAISRPGSAYGETVLAVGAGIRFNHDVDAAPTLVVHLYGGPDQLDLDVQLQLNEAILFHQAIGDQIHLALKGSDLDPDAVCEYYHPAGEQ